MDVELMKITMAAECSCRRVDVLDAFLESHDEKVAKATSASEVKRIARIELRVAKMLALRWEVRSKQAAKTAGRIVANGGTLTTALNAVDNVMKKWRSDVERSYTSSLEGAYRLARAAGHKRATGKLKGSLSYGADMAEVKKAEAKLELSFDLRDEKTIQALSKQEMIWIGETYAGVAPTVRAALDPKVLQGLGRAEAGKMVADAVGESLKHIRIPDGFKGSAPAYFEGLAANAVTNARVQGQLTSFARLGVTRYTIVNPMDSHTSLICQQMNGKVFTVKQGMDQLERMREAKTPEAYKAAQPWLSSGAVKGLVGGGSRALSEAGLALPPYHFRCRSTVDISEDSVAIDRLANEGVD